MSSLKDLPHPVQVQGHQDKRKRTRYRFALVLALLLPTYAVFRILKRTSSPRVELLGTIPERITSLDTPDIAYDPRLEAYQDPESAESCPEWPIDDATPGLSRVSFALSPSSSLLFFLSKGPYSSGHIEILQEDRLDHIAVNVTAAYHEKDDLQRTKACLISNKDVAESGVLLWADPDTGRTTNVSFNITVVLPDSITVYKDLTTRLPRFSHSISNFFHLWYATTFDIVRLSSEDAAVLYEGFVASSAYIHTSNANVSGFFAGPDKHYVQTTNAPIRSTSMMFGTGPDGVADVNLRTSNSPIEASVGLISDFDEGTFKANIHTTNGELHIGTPRFGVPDNSSFYLDASTSNAPALFYLHPQFEGTFDLQTSAAGVDVIDDSNIRDPSGKGRQRTLEKTRTGEHTTGFMYWSYNGEESPEGLNRGHVNIRTSSADITMHCEEP